MADAKSTLNCFIQKYCKKPITKQDIVYNVSQFSDQFQATVTLTCLEGVQFAGEIASNGKQAEQNAAAIALQNYADEVAAAMATPTKTGSGKKRKAADALVEPPVNPQDNAKVMVNNTLMRLLKRPLTKEDVLYSTVQTSVGFQCTISMPCLQGEWAGLAWAGEASTKKKAAEENAARHALEALTSEAGVGMAATIPVAKAPKVEKGNGKGPMTMPMMLPKIPAWQPAWQKGEPAWQKGEPAWQKGEPAWQKGAPAWQKGEPFWQKGGLNGGGMGMVNFGGGKGQNRGPPQSQPRERVTEVPISGVIIAWKGRYGWIEPHEQVDHPAATKNKGNIFLSKTDWTNQMIEPAEGTVVQCQVYVDPSGLGAEEVQAL